MPAYYEEYLQNKYPDEYVNPLEAFAAVGQTMDFPEMTLLLREVQSYRGNGISARFFMNQSILVICQDLFAKDFAMFFRKKGNFNKPSVKFFQKPKVSSIQYSIRRPAFRRCTVGF